MTGVEAAALSLNLNVEAVEIGCDVAEARPRMDDQGMVAADEGAASLFAAGRGHAGVAATGQPGGNVEAFCVHAVGVDTDLGRSLRDEPFGHGEHDSRLGHVAFERAIVPADAVRRRRAFRDEGHPE